MLGLPGGKLRPPLRPLGAEALAGLEAGLVELGLLEATHRAPQIRFPRSLKGDRHGRPAQPAPIQGELFRVHRHRPERQSLGRGLRRQGAGRPLRHAALHHLGIQFRYTYRQFRDAFRSHYPDVEILFANKSNNGLAIRHIMNQEGAGGDCFGVNEMYLALLAGTNPKTLVLNGSNKQTEELEMAIQNGLCINIDAEDELDRIDAICRQMGRSADVGIRLKLDLEPLAKLKGVAMHGPGTLKEQSDSTKWGMTREQTVEIVKRAQGMKHIRLAETHFHLSRMSNDPSSFAVMAREMIAWSAWIREATGWTPPTASTSAAAGPSANGTAPARAASSTTSPRRPRTTMRGCAARRSRTRRRSAACRCPSCGSSPAARSPARPASRSARSAR